MKYRAWIAKVISDIMFQDDRPLMPFLSKELEKLIRNIMKRFVRPEVLLEATSISKLLKVKVDDLDSIVHYHKVDIGFEASNILKDLLKNGQISQAKCLEFRIQCRNGLATIVNKLRDKKKPHLYTLWQMHCSS